MLDLKIERLKIEIKDAAGQEHRLPRIAERAAALLSERIDIRYGDGQEYAMRPAGDLKARPVDLDLRRTSDDQAASRIADAWLAAIALRLK